MNVIVFGGSSQQLANSLHATSFQLSENLQAWHELSNAVSQYQKANQLDRVPEEVLRKASLTSPAGRSVRLISGSEQVQVTNRVGADYRPSITHAMIAYEFCAQRIYVCLGVSDPWLVAAYLNWSDHDRLVAALYHYGAYFTSGPSRLPSCT